MLYWGLKMPIYLKQVWISIDTSLLNCWSWISRKSVFFSTLNWHIWSWIRIMLKIYRGKAELLSRKLVKFNLTLLRRLMSIGHSLKGIPKICPNPWETSNAKASFFFFFNFQTFVPILSPLYYPLTLRLSNNWKYHAHYSLKVTMI